MKRFIIEETECTEYDLTLLTAARMRSAVNELAFEAETNHNAADLAVMDYFLMNASVAPRMSEVIGTAHAIVNRGRENGNYTRDDIEEAIFRLARPGRNKFLRIGRRSQSFRGHSERLIELNYYHAEG